tara:strand:- start:81 stop:560 length:480 start_codon:yes stop_codon:yes gene_type:complete
MKTQLLNAFNAAIFADLIVLFLTLHVPVFNTPHLVEWYKKFKLGAVLPDVFILVLVIILTDYIYPKVFKSFSVIKYTGLAIVIQVIHDVLFYLAFKQIKNHEMFDLFNKYANMVGGKAILGDSFMMLICVLFYLFTKNYQHHSILAVFLIYLVPYLLYK